MAARLRTAFDLHAAGAQLQRQKLRNANPGANDATIDLLLRAWLRTRPGAERGDVGGDTVARIDG